MHNLLKLYEAGAANSQLALIHNVNFKIVKITIILEKKYQELYESKKKIMSNYLILFLNLIILSKKHIIN